MFSKKVCVIFLISALCVFVKVEAECFTLLNRYYDCKNPNATLDDAFYLSQLNGITTFNAAMEKFKTIYNELDWNNCSTTLCTCVKNDPAFDIVDYSAFFLNPNYYSDMVNILTAVRNKYNRINVTETNFFFQNSYNYSVKYPLIQFCKKNDYTFVDLFNYNETEKCVATTFMGSLTCSQYISNFTNKSDIDRDPQSYENYLKCSISLVSWCSVEIKRDIIFNFLSSFPGLIKNGLLTYIDSIISSADADGKNATLVWVTGDPHIYSVMQGMETCNFNTTLVCVESDNVTVNCTGEKISNTSSVTIMSEIKIRFTKNGQSSDFIADQTSFPTTLSNGQTTLQDTNGKNWLKLTTFNTNNFIVITDFNSNMVISIGKFNRNYFMVIQAPKSVFKIGGILFEGCPYDLRAERQTASRKKRASSNAASVCSSSTQQSGNSLISSSDLYAGCVNDVVVTGDESYATMYKSTLDAYSEVKTTFTSAFQSGNVQLYSSAAVSFGLPFIYMLSTIGFFIINYF